MKKLLSLDISSSTIGWALFHYDDNSAKLVSYGHIKPMSKDKANGSLPKRLDDANNKLIDLLNINDIEEVAVEDYAKRFSKGKSQANTIIMLAVFNEISCLSAYKKTGMEPLRYPVATIRKCVGDLFGVKIVSKDDIFPEIVKNCTHFNTVINKVGNVKKECGDEADAIAVGIATIMKKNIPNLIWDI